MTREPIPFTVIGGFLGAGKTTFVNELLRHASGERIAVLVNDFGSVSIDAALIAQHDGDTIALTNGCVCCSIGGDLALAVIDLLDAEPRFDRVVVEASGIADPGAVAQYGTLPGFRLDGVIVLADAETIMTSAHDDRIGEQVMHQLRRADVIVLTKPDVTDAEHLRATRTWLAATVPAGTPMVVSDRGSGAATIMAGVPSVAACASHDDAMRVGTHPVFRTITLVADEPVPPEVLTRFVDGLPVSVLRAKGVVYTPEPMVVQVVGTRRRITAAPASSRPGPRSELVLITLDADDALPSGTGLGTLDLPSCLRVSDDELRNGGEASR